MPGPFNRRLITRRTALSIEPLPIGIFAQRAKDRPNHIGATICRVVSVAGTTLEVAGLDAIDGTPVLDIKPYMREFGPRHEVVQPAWSHELMAGYY